MPGWPGWRCYRSLAAAAARRAPASGPRVGPPTSSSRRRPWALKAGLRRPAGECSMRCCALCLVCETL